MKKLSVLLARDFPRPVRERGYEYFLHRRVRITSGSARHVDAVVTGSGEYEVSLQVDGAKVIVDCECPSAVADGVCKHMWATILTAEAKSYLVNALLYANLARVSSGDDEDDAPPLAPGRRRRPAPPRVPEWQTRLGVIERGRKQQLVTQAPAWKPRRQLLYAIDVSAAEHHCLTLSLFTRERNRKDTAWNQAKEFRGTRGELAAIPDAADQEILALLLGCPPVYSYYGGYDYNSTSRFHVDDTLAGRLLPLICRTGRCFVNAVTAVFDAPLEWEEAGAWRFQLEATRTEQGCVRVRGVLKRGQEELDIAAPSLLSRAAVVVSNRVSRLEGPLPAEWVADLRGKQPLEASESEADAFLAALLQHPSAPPIEIAEELRIERIQCGPPRPSLKIRSAAQYDRWAGSVLFADLFFEYGSRVISANEETRGHYDRRNRQFLERDAASEENARVRLRSLGLKLERDYPHSGPVWSMESKKLPAVARALILEGWRVEAEGKIFRRPGASRLEFRSGVDWFELHGEIDFDGASAQLPELLAALRRGEGMVRLDDGSYGFLPEEWLARIAPTASMGSAFDNHVRFGRNQAGLLDALLAVQPEANFDAGFARARERLHQFERISAAPQPAGFAGQLREYQREGLGWMEFLRAFGFGGCLADDMGVGKTAQVLALLETRRQLRRSEGPAAGEGAPLTPSLIVVPKSLVFNWKQEAVRFTPQLRILDHTGLARNMKQLLDYDAVITTYGTLRRDVPVLREIEFDYIILDEAQAVKNGETATAKAVRLLRGRHRLALSGTPVENHLGELWSLFEFLNPGMLGASSVFNAAGGALRNPGEETRSVLAHAVRPFILRRTKQQVARELPPKTEQTIYCEMEPPQQRLYDELRDHYRNTLLQRVDDEGLGRSKMHVLEALLRLRQAACHPGLLDPKRAAEPSAKTDFLLDQLEEVGEEGHKTLVFSQFTTLLGLVRNRLDERQVRYEYLDGQTLDRQARVERFQTDPDCGLFLISLKAGGLGLNLTAAEYVFLLDPWWNPAVEAQAIDRTHRIGQTRQVFAYRLITRGTVEEKVLELQDTKRDLAAAIIGEDNSLIRNLRREDLELLLS